MTVVCPNYNKYDEYKYLKSRLMKTNHLASYILPEKQNCIHQRLFVILVKLNLTNAYDKIQCIKKVHTTNFISFIISKLYTITASQYIECFYMYNNHLRVFFSFLFLSLSFFKKKKINLIYENLVLTTIEWEGLG